MRQYCKNPNKLFLMQNFDFVVDLERKRLEVIPQQCKDDKQKGYVLHWLRKSLDHYWSRYRHWNKIKDNRSQVLPQKLKPLLCSQSLKVNTNYWIVKCYIAAILLYGLEALTSEVITLRRLEISKFGLSAC